MFSTSMRLLAASDENAIEREKILAWIHSMPDIIFTFRSLGIALDRKRIRFDELACIAGEMRRIIALHSSPRA